MQFMKNKIEHFLKQSGMTQRELAVKAEIAESQLNTIIRTQPNITIETASKIADALGVTIEEIFVTENHQKPLREEKGV